MKAVVEKTQSVAVEWTANGEGAASGSGGEPGNVRSHGSGEANVGCDLETAPVRRRHGSSDETARVQ